MPEERTHLIDHFSQSDAADQEVLIGQRLVQKDFESVALLLESLPLDLRLSTWQQIAPEKRLAVLIEMRSDPREHLFDDMSLAELDALFEGIEPSELVELSESLPERIIDRALNAMDLEQRKFFQVAQQYSDQQAGHWINQDFLVLPQNAKVRDALRLLRRNLESYTDSVFLVDRLGHFIAAVKISAAIGAPDHTPLSDINEDSFTTLAATDNIVDAAIKVQNSQFASLPVVDDRNILIGRIDIGSACDIVNNNYERQIMASAGMDEDEDLFAPALVSAKKRALWLGINLLTAFAASWFIGLFEATLQQVVVLAVLMPIVASMGGIAGSQTLTLIIRGIALDQVSRANQKALFKKEIRVGSINGIAWSIIIGVVVSFWFHSPMIGLVICLAILVNILASAAAGVIIPIVLNKIKFDPALSGSVILTTVTDIIGFVTFLGLGSIILT
ncbi:magnesium transporter [Reinekea thalattae]|uniref:Magnesium transporter n=1 Tax=Reinekea thalattae TaxID=2593301 RepID=A0A5C8ZC11_9GAMM|nr:magnesium transporter [Reinekea thalattae]TXR54370.1 magnesium transporter [Reinekea thalattae]